MSRFLALLLAFLVACSPSAPAETGAGSTTTSSAAPATTGSPPSTTTTTPSSGDAELEPPELPDPTDLAQGPLETLDVPGFDSERVDPDLLELVRVRIRIFANAYSASAFEELVSDDDDEVVAFSLYPRGSARGDPGLAAALADAIVEAGPTFDEPTQRTVGGRTALEVQESGTTWLLWANNTHLFVTAGADSAAADVMETLMEENDGSEYQWQPGDCLYFDDGVPYAPFGEANLVPCSGPHSWEVTRSLPLDDDTEDPFPGEELSERVGAACEEAFFEFVGVLPLDSPLNQVFYLPDESEWEEGDRYFACIISRNEGAGNAQLAIGSLAGTAETVTRDIGACYRRIVDVGITDCGSAHVFEYVGLATYPGDADADYPGGQELADAFEESCADLVAEYAPELVVEGAEVTPFPLGFGAFAWDLGVREVPCYAYATDDGAALEVVGSFSGGWGPLGEVGGSIQA